MSFKSDSAESKKPENDGNPIEVKIKCCHGNGVAIIVRLKPCVKIGIIKNKIAETHGIPRAGQTLRFNGEMLKDDCTLNDYDIQNGSILELYQNLTGC